MVSKNDITGDAIKTKVGDYKKFATGWDLAFSKKDDINSTPNKDVLDGIEKEKEEEEEGTPST